MGTFCIEWVVEMNRYKFDLEQEYGIVLEGGGAKGAYQIGVWKALKECNVKIKGIAGVSVGALNGVLMCMDDISLAEHIWTNITYSQVMDVNDSDMDCILHHDLKNLRLKRVTTCGAKAVTAGGFDITPLKQLVQQYIDEDKIRYSTTELYMGTLSLSGFKAITIDAKALKEGEIQDYLIASASLPLFKQEKLQGKTFLDGGIVNNVPIDMLLEREYKHIIVVRIYGIGMEKRVKIPENVSVVQISPRVSLGNILEFNAKLAQRNITIGYYDAMRVIKQLQGTIYYISEVVSEEEHANIVQRIHPIVIMAWLEYVKAEVEQETLNMRMLYEVILPQIAERLHLNKYWTYSDLYIAMLEVAAKALKVKKYRIYTEDEFIKEIRSNYLKYDIDTHEVDVFVRLITKTIAIEPL